MLFSRTIRQFIKASILKKHIQQANFYFTESRLNMLLTEWADWKENYAPFDLHNKTVLDIGAGEGETALFYLGLGAKKVICIEPDRFAFWTLARNARVFNETYRNINVQVYNRRFILGDLDTPGVDLIKIDVDGYEEAILDTDHTTLKTPMVLELHGLQLKDRFKEKGYRLNRHACAGWWTCYGFWKC